MQFDRWVAVFERNLLSPSSGFHFSALKIKVTDFSKTFVSIYPSKTLCLIFNTFRVSALIKINLLSSHSILVGHSLFLFLCLKDDMSLHLTQ
jgi:hypothetical protein